MTESAPTSERRGRRVDVRAVLLVALTTGPATGFELIGRIEQRSGGAWRPEAAAVYPMLQQLEDEGLVTLDASSGKRLYAITASGEAGARHAVLDGTIVWPQPEAALRRDLLRAVGAFTLATKQMAATASADQLAAAIEFTHAARQQLLEALGHRSESRPDR